MPSGHADRLLVEFCGWEIVVNELNLINQKTLVGALAAGFILVVLIRIFLRKNEKSPEDAVQTSMTRMSFLVSIAAIKLILLGVLALYFVGVVFVFDLGKPVFLEWSQPVVFLLAGSAYGQACFLRTINMGRSVWLTLLGIVPVANLYLWFAPPGGSFKDQDLRPSGTMPRFLVSLVALTAFLASDYAFTKFKVFMIGQKAARYIQQDLFLEKAIPPTFIVKSTRFDGMKVHAADEDIVFLLTLTDEAFNRDSFRSWLREKMLPEQSGLICGTHLIANRDWTIWYEYYDATAALVASEDVSRQTCDELGFKPKQ